MVKYIKKFISIILSCTFLGSCGQKPVIFKDTEADRSHAFITQLVDIIEEKDPDKMKELFSVKAEKEADNLTEQVDGFFEVFDDSDLEVEIEENAGPAVYESIEYGDKSIEYSNIYEVQGKNKHYTIQFILFVRDDFDKDNEGLYTLRIIEDKDYKKQYDDVDEEAMERPGLYYNP